MLQIRGEAATDIEPIWNVHASAFPTPVEARLVGALRAHGNALISLVAEEDGKIVGHVLFAPVVAGEGAECAVGAGLGPVAVAPAHQRKGIGAKLVEAGIQACRDVRVKFVVVLGEPGYYGRFGFRRASDFGLSSEYGAVDEFMVLEIAPAGLAGATGLVRYAPEFRDVEP